LSSASRSIRSGRSKPRCSCATTRVFWSKGALPVEIDLIRSPECRQRHAV
jgi:hypothetical protein